MFGDEFKRAYPYLLVFMVGQFINTISGSSGYLLAMSGYEKILKNIVVISGLTSVIATFVLGYLFSAMGAAIAVSFCIILNNFLIAVFIFKKMGYTTIPGLQWIRAK
jgi:O-antigen/teichoic acid export membrane protein